MVDRILLFAKRGLAFGVGYSIIAVLIISIAGTPEDKAGPIVPVVIAYCVSGVFAGALIGALLPHVDGALSAMIVGFVAAVPVCCGVAFAAGPVMPPSPLSPVAGGLVVAFFLGPAAGLIFYRMR